MHMQQSMHDEFGFGHPASLSSPQKKISQMPSRTTTLFCLLLGAACDAVDPLLAAICKKDSESLKKVVDAAAERGKAIDGLPENPNLEELRAAIYKQAQGEVPGQEPKPYPGCEAAGASAGTNAGAGKKPPADMMSQMADMLLKKKDVDKDGKLSREEMQQLIDATNAQAKAGGQAEVDFFKAVDKDGDDLLNREELQAFFKAQQGAAGAGAGAAKPKARAAAKAAGTAEAPPDYAALMFKSLDKDRDGVLSREEMKRIIEQTNQQKANQQDGDKGEDFFDTMDKDQSGGIDKDEAAAFFALVANELAQGAGAGAKKDEV